jgi:catechol 2,3-dioxygenase-like lactoylglutathione lyase family enzyme
MIAGVHALIYAEDAEAARAFFRDVLGLRSVDAGEGWLIFALPPAELGIHPGPGILPSRAVGAHELFLMCHDIEQTVADLASKGVEIRCACRRRGLRPHDSLQDPRRRRDRPVRTEARESSRRVRPFWLADGSAWRW